MSGHSTGTVRAGDLRIYFERGGSGPRLLFISGTGGDLRVRPNVFDGPLPHSFEVLAFDQRGLGQTSKPPGPYHMADYADDAARLLDAQGWDCVPVLGVSFGGMVAQELALRHGHRVRCLALACTSAGGAGGASFPLHEIQDLPEQQRLERHLALADRRRDAAWQAAHPEEWAALLELARQARPPAPNGRAPTTGPGSPGARAQLQARAGHDTWDRLARLNMPVLVAGGRHDGIAPPENQEALARRIPGAELQMFEGGHLFMIQDKQAYPSIIRWLRAHVQLAQPAT